MANKEPTRETLIDKKELEKFKNKKPKLTVSKEAEKDVREMYKEDLNKSFSQGYNKALEEVEKMIDEQLEDADDCICDACKYARRLKRNLKKLKEKQQ